MIFFAEIPGDFESKSPENLFFYIRFFSVSICGPATSTLATESLNILKLQNWS